MSAHFIGIEITGGQLRQGGVHELAHVGLNLAFGQNANGAQCGPAQGKRVLVAGGFLAHGKNARQRIHAVGQRQHLTQCSGRNGVTGKSRFVLFTNGLCHGRVFALFGRVITAHDALKLGKFPHHVRQQIGFGQLRRAHGRIGVQAIGIGQGFGQVLHPRGFFGQAAEGFLEHHGGELFGLP